MHQAFQLYTDSIGATKYRNYEPEEIDLVLNIYQDTFVKERMGVSNATNTAFEGSQKRTDDLRAIVRRAALSVNSPINQRDNSVVVTLPSDYWFSIGEEVRVSTSNCPSKMLPVVPTVHDVVGVSYDNKYKAASKRRCLRLMEGNEIIILHHPTVIVSEFFLHYIKKPIKVNYFTGVDCELADSTHDEVVKGAAQLANTLAADPRRGNTNLQIPQE